MALAMVGSIDLNNLQKYLLSTGWNMDATLGNNIATVWHHPDDYSAEVVLPATTDIKDYRARMNDVFTALSRFESRSIDEVCLSVRSTGGENNGKAPSQNTC